MSERSFYQTLRKRVAPLAFLAALVVLGTRTCATEQARVHVRLELGGAAAQVRSVRVDVVRKGEVGSVMYIERHFGPGGSAPTVEFDAALDAGDYRLHIELHMTDGVRRIERAMHATEQAEIRVDLAQDLVRARDGA